MSLISDRLRKWGFISTSIDDGTIVNFTEPVNTVELLQRYTRQKGWAIVAHELRHVPAVDETDNPDKLGYSTGLVDQRVRTSVALDFRVQSVDLSASVANANLAGSSLAWSVRCPLGATMQFNSESQRSYQNAVVSAYSGNTVATSQSSVTAGFQMSILVGRLEHGYFRVRGTMNNSTFEGSSTDTDSDTVNVDVDLPRDQWTALAAAEAISGGISPTWRTLSTFAGSLSAGASCLVLEVRVRP